MTSRIEGTVGVRAVARRHGGTGVVGRRAALGRDAAARCREYEDGYEDEHSAHARATYRTAGDHTTPSPDAGPPADSL
jgi:hypothetical protein